VLHNVEVLLSHPAKLDDSWSSIADHNNLCFKRYALTMYKYLYCFLGDALCVTIDETKTA